MKLTISNQQITITEATTLVCGTENVYTAEYVFGDEWDDYTKTAVFEGYDGTIYEVQLDSTNTATIPNNAIASSGYVRFGVIGEQTVSGTTMIYPTVWSEKVFVDQCAVGNEVSDE